MSVKKFFDLPNKLLPSAHHHHHRRETSQFFYDSCHISAFFWLIFQSRGNRTRGLGCKVMIDLDTALQAATFFSATKPIL